MWWIPVLEFYLPYSCSTILTCTPTYPPRVLTHSVAEALREIDRARAAGDSDSALKTLLKHMGGCTMCPHG